jgi:hypothetical protein
MKDKALRAKPLCLPDIEVLAVIDTLVIGLKNLVYAYK